jgi:hypothetical protein
LDQAQPPDGFEFQDYLRVVKAICETFSHPWPYLEEQLRCPMAAMEPNGALLLPDDVQARLLGGGLLLYMGRNRWPFQQEAFGLRDGKESPKLFVKASYDVPVLPGFRVRLPDDALWVLGLRGGGRLAWKTSLAQITFEPVPADWDPGKRLWDLEPDGTLALPDSLRNVPESWLPIERVSLTVTLSPEPEFQIAAGPAV